MVVGGFLLLLNRRFLSDSVMAKCFSSYVDNWLAVFGLDLILVTRSQHYEWRMMV